MNRRDVQLGDGIHVKHGFAFKGEHFANAGKYMVLTPGNFLEKGGFRTREGKERYYHADFPEEYLLNEGDLIVAMTEQGEGLLGSAARIPAEGRYLHNQRLGLVQIVDGNLFDKSYLYWVFNSSGVRAQIRATATGAKVKHTAPERIKKVRISVPAIAEQKAIAQILDSYDDLITINQRRIVLLEEAARRLYREWFVYLRFPGHERAKVADGMPLGWERRPLSSVVKVNEHSIGSKEMPDEVRQAIHHWRGASVRSLMKFEQSFKGSGDTSSARKYSLDLNRRSSQEILDLFSIAGRVHTLQQELPLDEMCAANGKSSSLPQLISCDERTDIAEAIAQEVLGQNGKGIAFRNQAILCKRGADIEFMSDYLRRAKIPVLHIGELAQRPEVKQLVCLMQILCEREPRALVGLANVPSLSMPWVDILRLLECSRGDIAWQRGRWLGQTFEGMSAMGCAASANLRTLLRGFSRHTNPWQFVCDLLLERRFIVPHSDDASIEAQTIRIALWQFAYSVRNGDGDVRQARLSRFLLRQQLRQRIGETYADRELPPEASEMDAVRLLTVHASKGLEFTSVHVGYVDSAFFGSEHPKWGTSEPITHLVPPAVLGSSDKEFAFESAIERNNLFYVALSRAKLQLRLYESGVRKASDRLAQLRNCGAKYQLKKFNPSAAAAEVKPITGAPMAQAPKRVSLDEFEAYIRCPLQHHYRYHLGLRREQETDVSIRARWAVMETLHVIAQGGATPQDAFVAAWQSHRLPPKTEDAGLQRDAIIACRRGLNVLRNNDGVLRESLVAKIGGIEVELPWVIENEGPEYHMIRFSARGANATRDTLRPLLLDLVDGDSGPMVLHTLVGEKEIEVEQSKWVERTGAYKAALRLDANERGPKPGRHCGRCAYLGMCPVVPV